jgi:putative iron-regulated protein
MKTILITIFNMKSALFVDHWLVGGFACAALLGFSACGDSAGTGGTGGGGAGSGLSDTQLQPVVDSYAENVHTNYALVLDRAKTLETAVSAFVEAPSVETHQAAKDAWNAARPAYLQSEVYRFYNGPIDNEETGPEGKINGWPLDENYIDYVAGNETAGIVNDPEGFPQITQAGIAEANEAVNEKSLSAGFHAIEFLLWGQDLNEQPNDAGLRSHTDYLAAGGTALNAERRGTYLKEVTALLVADLESVKASWEPSSDNYRREFVADPRSALQKILTGMGSLAGGELRNERMNNAYQERDQEEEHSCFSDTTHVDHLNDAIGIENVYLGRFGAEDGPGLDDLVASVDPELDARMKADLAAVIAAIGTIPVPFDQAINDEAVGGGREKIKLAMEALAQLTDTTVEVATALGVTINLE